MVQEILLKGEQNTDVSYNQTKKFEAIAAVLRFFFRLANYTFHIAGDFGNYENSGYIVNINDINPNGEAFLSAVSNLMVEFFLKFKDKNL